jgi:hypothetical protein
MQRTRPGPLLGFLRQARESWLRHLLLGLSLVVLTLGIVGMHQLSVGHDVATGQASGHAHAETAASGPVEAVPHGHGPAEVALADSHLLAASAATDVGGYGDEGCLTCDDHEMAFRSCLLALTLLVFSWLLRPPRLRHLPPFLLPRLAPAMIRLTLSRLVPSLSLTELSLRRT